MSQQEEKVSLIAQMHQSPTRPRSYGLASPIINGQDVATATPGNRGTLWSPKCKRGVGREQPGWAWEMRTGQEIPEGNVTGL